MDDRVEDNEVTESDVDTTEQSAFDEEVDHQISRMMGEGGVAPPVQPRPWKTWKQDKKQLKADDDEARFQ
ncbi:hypothetical protein [Alicyclobacillus sp. SO9]|uniref:hypothetical protein n=1 Tax=Alicyclobacillus sp. SO9 TaxID=2665646 RepID=UPI0018E785E3|nr:hypothetical protein [Alicyclobacillus sp. SO9]QQE77677.1 hypothetical protein GI364_17305 [Alicyclobacillus sp. SO9]